MSPTASRRRLRASVSIALVAVAAAWLAACGQMGPLSLPEPELPAGTGEEDAEDDAEQSAR